MHRDLEEDLNESHCVGVLKKGFTSTETPLKDLNVNHASSKPTETAVSLLQCQGIITQENPVGKETHMLAITQRLTRVRPWH